MSVASAPSEGCNSAQSIDVLEAVRAVQPARPVAVSELKRAWTAIRSGEFRQQQRRAVISEHGICAGEPPRAESSSHATAAHRERDQDVEDTRNVQDIRLHGGCVDGPVEGHVEGPVGRLAPSGPTSRWVQAAGERVVPVVAAAGSVGCSTVAIAMATAAAHGRADRTAPWLSRVVECSSAHTSGLAAASTAELGRHESGWIQGTREAVLLERSGEVVLSLDAVPTPSPLDQSKAGGEATAHPARPSHPTGAGAGAVALTVIDAAWDAGQLAATRGWIGHLIRTAPVVIVVARPTIPGFRRLEATLEILERGHPRGHIHGHVQGRAGGHAGGHDAGLVERAILVAVIGGPRKRWPRGVQHSAGPLTRAALREQRLHDIPEDRRLVVTGLDSTPLPPALLSAADQLLRHALAIQDAAPSGAPPAERLGAAEPRQFPGAGATGRPASSQAGDEAIGSATHHPDTEPHDGTATDLGLQIGTAR